MIRVRIQHHPARKHLLPGLRWKLEPLPTEVVGHSSEPPSPWAGYRRCCQDPPECSHLLIIQDDALPCENFVPALGKIAQQVLDAPVCLFLSALPMDASRLATRAMGRERRYVVLPYRGFMPVVAVLWPIQKLHQFHMWSLDNPMLAGREPRSDDAMAGMWKIRNRERVLATVPSLVEHDDGIPSLIGTSRKIGDRSRRALFLAEDALAYDWTLSGP